MNYQTFCTKYDKEKSLLYVLIGQGTIPAHVLSKEGGRFTEIDEDFFLDRIAFKDKVMNLSHSYYYYFSKYFSCNAMAEMFHKMDEETTVGTWNMFLAGTLFMASDYSITNYKITKLRWKFFKLSRTILRELLNHKGHKLESYDLESVWR